jgi:tetratricopeptide (TPR) repeat protein
VPASVGALVVARLDALEVGDRIMLHRCAVGGLEVETDLLRSIGEPAPDPAALARLVRTAFLAPSDDDSGHVAFRHILVRDAVYGAVPKRERARLHEAFGSGLERLWQGRVEADERIGYHLEAATRFRRELRLPEEQTEAIARRGADRLAAAGMRASAGGTMGSAADLLGRATDLLPPDSAERASLLPELGKVRLEAGHPRTRATLDEAVERTAAAGLERENAHARIHRYLYGIWFERAVDADRDRGELEGIAEALESSGDDRGAALAWAAVAEIEWFRGRLREATGPIDRAAALADRAGDRRAYLEYLALGIGDASGEMTVEEAERRSRAALVASNEHPVVAARAYPMLGSILAERGDVEGGRALIQRSVELTKDLGLRVWEGEMLTTAADFELEYGDPVAAHKIATSAYAVDLGLGDRAHIAAAAALMAKTSAALGLDEEALRWADASHRARPSDTSPTEIWWLTAVVSVHLRGGQAEEAERSAHRAIELAPSDRDSGPRARAEAALGTVLVATGRPEEGRRRLEEAAAMERRLGLAVSAARHEREARDVSAT